MTTACDARVATVRVRCTWRMCACGAHACRAAADDLNTALGGDLKLTIFGPRLPLLVRDVALGSLRARRVHGESVRKATISMLASSSSCEPILALARRCRWVAVEVAEAPRSALIANSQKDSHRTRGVFLWPLAPNNGQQPVRREKRRDEKASCFICSLTKASVRVLRAGSMQPARPGLCFAPHTHDTPLNVWAELLALWSLVDLPFYTLAEVPPLPPFSAARTSEREPRTKKQKTHSHGRTKALGRAARGSRPI